MSTQHKHEGTPEGVKLGFAGKLVALFINSPLTPLLVIVSILMGLAAIIILPREEEPQIKVPMVDVLVAMPGASASEVEARVTRPMEKLLWEIPGVEYIYSTSMPGQCMAVVRFKVGADLEQSLVKLNQKLQTNFDRIPHGATSPLVKPHTIDDVPVLALTFHSPAYDHSMLRRVAAEVDDAIKSLPDVAETRLIGGTRRVVRVQIDPLALASRELDVIALQYSLQAANQQTRNGALVYENKETLVQTGVFLSTAEDVGAIVVGTYKDKPVYLRDVAAIQDTAEEPSNYVLHGSRGGALEAAVTLSIAKKPGTNAIHVVRDVMAVVERLKGQSIPSEIGVTVTRDYGATASEKSNELLLHMGIAIFGVAILILFFLGWRESLVVLLAIPSTLGLSLVVFYLYGYTLNRITLFALIFSIGILVDDAIVVVENIVRHARLPSAKRKPLSQIALEAVDEVGNPTILATWAVIAAILPMAFVGGLMGPYMRPIPVGASAAMIFSLLIAFTITPWAALRVLRRHLRHDAVETPSPEEESEAAVEPHDGHEPPPNDIFTRLYHRIMEPLLAHAGWRWVFLGVIVLMLLGAMALVPFGAVKVKMLPFDNKPEFQVILNMPEGSTLEQTAQVAREIAAVVDKQPEVENFQIYAGTASPFNFNGLVRHYFIRSGPTVADVQVNLVPKHARSAQSHDIAKRVRSEIAAVAKRYGAAVEIAEVPPGPPVLQTLVAEIYGPTQAERLKLATAVKGIFEHTEGVVDVDWYVEGAQDELRLAVDKEKAALHGISEQTIARTVQLAIAGASVDLLHVPGEKEDVNIVLELPRDRRIHAEDLLSLQVRAENDPQAQLVSLRELVSITTIRTEPYIYHKNLRPVVYVTGDVAGSAESPAYALFTMNRELAKLDGRTYGGTEKDIELFHLNLPKDDLSPAIKWDGEWHITLEVFRDLGLAFATVCVLIFMLMVGWFGSYKTPLVVMAAIPFSLIGILPAHALMGAFFTATSMIGFMAGAGIVVRNSIILVDFIELRQKQGLALAEAVVEAGAVRFRPMLLTALAVVVGASVILADPIFQGLALSLMFGEIASLLISRMAVPVIYFMANQDVPTAKK
ncbi:MAG: efflux RND transporter permease subunit [Verrucomicrobiota bacterium]|nr:efflux RND transporter permease subunit [Verrucomicrobiota bacterium]